MDEQNFKLLSRIANALEMLAKEVQLVRHSIEFIAAEVDNGRFNPK